ncbi:HAMP domain-containing histidine kinase [Sphingomonas sp. LB-2]|uniref:sensor histidine kinase n=1 Tax=Sphingomonas caeni TaxID=2984949 RepID=UPI0022324437|nr:HAMP domain-containing sensor histidine kinase [Sphingomonas caeni]MCW3848208.1 HAMP domain-containing histidine kinase [Sphingomonas caeni]
MIARLKSFLKRYWPSLSLRTILFGTLLFVAALPGVGAVFLRVYENTLVQQTEAELIAQSAVLASAYRIAWGAPAESRAAAPEPPGINLSANALLPPLPIPEPAGVPDRRSVDAARKIAPIVDDAAAVTLSDTRLLDGRGVIIGGHGDVGLSYETLPEVQEAQKGHSATVLRRRRDRDGYMPSFTEMVSTAAAIRVHHVRPVVVQGRVVGMVMLARSPRGIFLGVWQDRANIALGVVLIFMTLLVLAGLLSRGIARPIRALAAASQNVARGTIDIPEPPVTAAVEIRELYVNFRQMAERIEARARYLRDFAAAVSHEFKTPLTGIRGAIELLDEHGAEMSPADRARFLANAHADADRLSRLVQRLLDMARADMTSAGEDERADAAAVARAVAEGRGDAKMAVEVKAVPGLPPARISADALETVLVTLVDNSRQARAKRVSIRLEERDGQIAIHVADNGKGISAGDRERVFEPFFTANRERGGTGLGLPIARSLLAATGGTIALEERAKGAAFVLKVPVAS